MIALALGVLLLFAAVVLVVVLLREEGRRADQRTEQAARLIPLFTDAEITAAWARFNDDCNPEER